MSQKLSASISISRPKLDTEKLPTDLCKFVERNAALLRRMGWKKFINFHPQGGNLNDLHHINHPAVCLLKHYQTHSASAKFLSLPWSRFEETLHCGPDESCHEYH